MVAKLEQGTGNLPPLFGENTAFINEICQVLEPLPGQMAQAHKLTLVRQRAERDECFGHCCFNCGKPL